MRKLGKIFVLAVAALWFVLPPAQGQSLDVAFGLNALTASQAASSIPRLGGGLFPSASADLHLGAIGVGAEVAFRATKDSTDLRPVYYDVNLLLVPFSISRSIVPELMVGLGAQSIQDYSGLTSCGGTSSCVNYASTHLAGHVGIAIKAYITGHIFLRPEAHFYFIRNNQQLDASQSQRFGISLGYTFGGS